MNNITNENLSESLGQPRVESDEIRDQVFAQKIDLIKPFAFDENVAAVFDDMVARSIPFYEEIIRIVLDMTNKYYDGQGVIYDLGCSTGNTIKAISEFLTTKNSDFFCVGVDNSKPMIEKAKIKLADYSQVSLLEDNLEDISLENAKIVILNYTLQFIPHSTRLKVLKKVYENLAPGGIVIISEKVKSDDFTVEKDMTSLYYDFKRRNGYSELEISQKREALENVLVPMTIEEQLEMVQSAGFKSYDLLFKWYNFASYLGIKGC